jgi:hypothetical protein
MRARILAWVKASGKYGKTVYEIALSHVTECERYEKILQGGEGRLIMGTHLGVAD